MIFYQNKFLNENDAIRKGASLFFTVALHIIAFYFLIHTQPLKIISAETFSAPTNVAIRFISPQKIQIAPEKITREEKVKKVIPKAEAKKIETKKATLQEPKELNKIEPAAAPQINPDIAQKMAEPNLISPSKQVPQTIPVTKQANFKGRRVQPEYPKRALQMRHEGIVLLHVLIDEGGKRQDIKLHQASQYALLNQAALKAVKKWRFDPNIVNGMPVKSWVEIPIEFKIQ